MARTIATSSEYQTIPARNNMYTALAGAAVLLEIIAFALLYFRYQEVFGTGIFG